MKGLLIKDWKLLKNQKQFFLVILVIGILFLVTQENPSFTITYTTMMFTMFTMNTISYDEFDNGGAYLFTLPITRRQYVTEKYIFGVLCSLISWIIISIVGFVAGIVKHSEIPAEEFVAISLSALLVGGLILAFSVPLQLKFGVEKSRMAFVAVFAIAFLIGFCVIKFADLFSVDVTGMVRKVSQISFAAGVTFLIVFCLILLIVSWRISVRIEEKKEY